jgi:hypothetical protein
MRRRLPSEWSKLLAGLPESGMGYQRVDIRFSDGSVQHDCPVFNAEELEIPDRFATKEIADVKLHRAGRLSRT